MLGPYQGILSGTAKGAAMDDHGEALKACYERAGCAGVSTDWYLGAPWYPVLGVKSFTPDSASYGCTLLLDRSEEE